jgi:putative membrane protein
MLKLIIIVAVVLLGAALTALNPQLIRFDYYFGLLELPLSWLLVAALSIGGLLGMASSLLVMLDARRDQARLRRKLRVAEYESESLRMVSKQED